MIKKKNQLFRIISALKPSEKAYFKKFGYKLEKQQSDVILLFDLIDKQLKQAATFHEETLVTSFEKKAPQQNYTKIKSRLLEILLDALRDYDKKGNETEKIFDYLAYAESLKKRELFYDAWSVLQKAEKLAEELEMTELLIFIKSKRYYYEIFTQKYQVTYAANDTINAIFEDVQTLHNRIGSDLAAYRILHFQKSIGTPRSQEDFGLLEEIKKLPSFEEGYRPELESSKLNLAVALAGVYFSIGDTASVARVGEQVIREYNPSEKLRKMYSAKYLSLFDSFLQAALLSLNIPLFETYYPIFAEVPTYGQDDRNLKIGIDLYTRSIYAIVAKKLEIVPDLAQEFNQVKEKSYIPNYRKVSLAYYMVFGSFLREDFNAAYEQIQWMKNNHQLGMRYDIEIGILAMECVILLEKKELTYLEYRLRSFNDFLKRTARKFKMESAFLQLIRQALAAVDAKAEQVIFAKARSEMKEIVAANPAENTFLQAFDVISWLESNIQKEPFQEVYFRNNLP